MLTDTLLNDSHMFTNNLISSSQVAAYCHVSPRTVAKWFDTKLLKGYRVPGGPRRFSKPDVAKFIYKHGLPMPEELRQYIPELCSYYDGKLIT